MSSSEHDAQASRGVPRTNTEDDAALQSTDANVGSSPTPANGEDVHKADSARVESEEGGRITPPGSAPSPSGSEEIHALTTIYAIVADVLISLSTAIAVAKTLPERRQTEILPKLTDDFEHVKRIGAELVATIAFITSVIEANGDPSIVERVHVPDLEAFDNAKRNSAPARRDADEHTGAPDNRSAQGEAGGEGTIHESESAPQTADAIASSDKVETRCWNCDRRVEPDAEKCRNCNAPHPGEPNPLLTARKAFQK